jgi:hypothetical protein
MLVQAKAFYLFLLLMSSHGDDDVLGNSVDAEGPDLNGASTIYSRPGPPNLFGEDNEEVRNEIHVLLPVFTSLTHFFRYPSLQNGQRDGLVDDGDGGPRGNDFVPRRTAAQMRSGRGGGDVHYTASTSTSNDLKKNTVRGGLGAHVCAYYKIECIFAISTSWKINTNDSVLSFARDRRPLLMLIASSFLAEFAGKVTAVSFLCLLDSLPQCLPAPWYYILVHPNQERRGPRARFFYFPSQTCHWQLRTSILVSLSKVTLMEVGNGTI